jgi:hypothetical protein
VSDLIFLILAGSIGLSFGLHAWIGWTTGIARIPLQFIAFAEAERDRSPENFWGVLVLDALISIGAVVWAIYLIWKLLGVWSGA